MKLKTIVYADFNSPLCYLAGLWADRRRAEGIETDWRAVEHLPSLSHLGVPNAAAPPALLHELVEAARLPVPEGRDRLPDALPQIISNTQAATAAYAEAVTDGVHDELRRHLLRAIWIENRHLSSAYEVRRIITDITYPRVPIGPYSSSDLPLPVNRDPDLWRAVRRSGGTIAPDGGPLTTIAYRRIRTWREQWRALDRPDLPVLIDERGALHAGQDAVVWLAGQPAPTPVRPLPVPSLL
ncbi:hypothetical protein [Catenulispora subtropica]|uniref:DSBA-like thioredoxin domain-containing protein n=1 Tax=Catenulispora subtropica TaxID=450798 RepID=A0ABN2QRT6_9ACTN